MKIIARPYMFVNDEMIKFAEMLSEEDVEDDKVLKAAFLMTSSRFESPAYTLNPLGYYKPRPSGINWDKGGKKSSFNQCLVLCSMLLLTGRFGEKDIIFMKTLRKRTIFKKPHFYLKVQLDKKYKTLDSFGYNWGIPYWSHLGKKGSKLVPRTMEFDCINEFERDGITFYKV